jgi:hypothetical protein
LPTPPSQPSALQDTIMNLARSKAHRTVRELYEMAKGSQQTLSEKEFVQRMLELAAGGRIELEESIPSNLSFWKFLGAWYLNSWLYVVLGVAAATLGAIYELPQAYPFVVLRWAAGSVFVLFLPGYVSLRALFPKRELDSVENFALSLGLSLAVVPLMGLVLNYTSWGITLNALVVSLIVYVLVVAFAAAERSFHLLRVNPEFL